MPAISGSVFPLYPMKNGISKSIKGMPQKDFTSDAENSFAMDRSQYVNTLGYKTNTSIPVQNHKKWLGNRDASQVTTNRRIAEVGVGTLNANNVPFAFNSTRDVNTVNDAIRRTRCGGAVAPKKKNACKISPIPLHFPPAKLVRTKHCEIPRLAYLRTNASTNPTTSCKKLCTQGNTLAKIHNKEAMKYKTLKPNNYTVLHP
jgi:hypothetical protein